MANVLEMIFLLKTLRGHVFKRKGEKGDKSYNKSVKWLVNMFVYT